MGINLEAINVIAELERYAIAFDFAGGDELKIICPFHADTHPSCNVNVVKKVFKCQVCASEGDIVGLLARSKKVARGVIIRELSDRYDIEEQKTIDALTVERYHENIWTSDALRNELYRRGLTDAIIRRRRFGVNDNRITIPVPAKSGVWVNVRSYLPGAAGKDKMRNARGYGAIRWYPIDQLNYDTILLCGGECKALVAAEELNQYGIGCITATAGEKNLDIDLVKELQGKRVYICMDVDIHGEKAAKKHAKLIRNFASFTSIIALPLDKDVYPKGDINDYCVAGGKLKPLIDEAVEFADDAAIDYLAEDNSDPVPLVFSEAIHAEHSRKRITVKGVVSMMDSSPYFIPKDIKILCEKGSIKECAICPVFTGNKDEFTIPRESPALLEFIGASTVSQLDTVKGACRIPSKCRVCEFTATSEYNIEDARISPQLEITNRFSDKQPVPAYCIGEGLQLNEAYELTGKLLPHPKTQQATLLISAYNPTQDALSTYTVENAHDLSIFWPNEWSVEAIESKLNDIYEDFEANVTKVFKRREMHLTVDLAYHSPLFLPFDGETVKGWVEVLIIGDSSNGKSKTTLSMRDYYGLGRKMECKNATTAGIIGGMEKMGERWFATWGMLPNQDRRLVIWEEVKGMNVEVIAKTTDTRSSGVAQMVKIGQNWQTQARARGIWLSNPRGDGKVASSPFGVVAVKDLIGSPEDIRRFDMALLISDVEIDPSELNRLQSARPSVDNRYTGDLCRQLILWAWTRDDRQVKFTDEATKLILSEATALSNQFSDMIPLIDRGSMRHKLARLSASLAARLFSCSEDFESLVIYPAHVEYICRFLREIYLKPVMGYGEFTKAQRNLEIILDPHIVRAMIEKVPHPRELCESMLAQDYIEHQDFIDWTMWTKEECNNLVSLFVRKHALVRRGKYYRKAPAFIEMLKYYAASNGKYESTTIHEEKF